MMNKGRTLLISVLILLGGAALTWVIFLTEPTAERTGAVRQSAMLVEVAEAETGTYRPTIRAMGTVEPSRDITLAPRVGGEVVAVAEGFTPGGYVREGEVLLRIDPADYENALAQRRSALSQAEADLAVERGRQDVARQDYELLRDTLAAEDRSLVLREPQLQAAQARVEAARAAVEQSELDLRRTTIRAPFDAHVLTRAVNLGSQVSPGEALGRLVGLDTYWVVTTVPQSQLRWLRFPDGDTGASPVQIRNRTAWESGEVRAGTLHRLVGALEGQTRLARVIVDVPDPMARSVEGPPLMIGSFVEAVIEAEPLTGVVRLDRSHVRDDETVWVMTDSTLDVRNVRIAFEDARYAYIDGGLEAGERVVTTDLATVVDGALLRVADAGESASGTDATRAATRSSGADSTAIGARPRGAVARDTVAGGES